MLILLMLLRICWVIALLLGLSLWSGHLLQLISLHMLLGLIIAVLVATLAIAAGRRRLWGLLVAGLVVAVLLPIVGLNQTTWLPGPNHWLVELFHLLLGVVAIAIAEVSAQRIKRLA
ncbi:MAG: hypothetical protein ACREP9_16455 [Candidatus Dormibacteraceae bacterium]